MRYLCSYECCAPKPSSDGEYSLVTKCEVISLWASCDISGECDDPICASDRNPELVLPPSEREHGG